MIPVKYITMKSEIEPINRLLEWNNLGRNSKNVDGCEFTRISFCEQWNRLQLDQKSCGLAYRIGKRWMFDTSGLHAWIKSRKVDRNKPK